MGIENIERGWKWSKDKKEPTKDDEEDTSDLDEVVNEKNLSEDNAKKLKSFYDDFVARFSIK